MLADLYQRGLERGLRERIVKVADAPGLPFDDGRFELIEEPIPTPGTEVPPPPSVFGGSLVKLRTGAAGVA